MRANWIKLKTFFDFVEAFQDGFVCADEFDTIINGSDVVKGISDTPRDGSLRVMDER